MKRALSVLFILATTVVLLAAPSKTSNVTLAWNPNTETNIVSYRVYWGGATRNYTNQIQVIGVNTTNATVTNLPIGAIHFFAVTAINTAGLESDYSNEVTYSAASPAPVSGVRITTVAISP